MAGSGERNNPLTSFNFIVDIEGIQAGFTEVSGLTSETTMIEYREGSDKTTARKISGQTKFPVIVLKNGFSKDTKKLWDLRKEVIEGKTKYHAVTITLQDEGQNAALVWQVRNAVVSKFDGPALNAKNNDIAILTLELTHEGLILT